MFLRWPGAMGRQPSRDGAPLIPQPAALANCAPTVGGLAAVHPRWPNGGGVNHWPLIPAVNLNHTIPTLRSLLSSLFSSLKPATRCSASAAPAAPPNGVIGEFVGSALFQLIGSACTLGGASASLLGNTFGLVVLSEFAGAWSRVHACHRLPAAPPSLSAPLTSSLASTRRTAPARLLHPPLTPHAHTLTTTNPPSPRAVYAFAGVSGAHLNPAVSFMLYLRKQIGAGQLLQYSAAQVAGCVAGAALCALLIPGVALGMGAAGPGCWAPAAGLGAGAIFAWEALMTALLCLTVWGAAVAKPGAGVAAPIGIGLVVMTAGLACGNLSGGIINPARALGPAIAFGGAAAGTVALYLAAQFAGAALAATLTKAMSE